MSRLTRREMKRDEVLDTLTSAVGYVQRHFRKILGAAAALVLAAAVAAGVFLVQGHREAEANRLLTEALRVLEAPLVADDPRPDDPRQPSFADAAARRAGARELLEEVRGRYGGSEPARVATAVLGRLAVEAGDPERARSLWTEILDRPDGSLLTAEVRVNLIHLDRAQGRGRELAEELRGMLEDGEPPLPEDLLLYELALTLEALHRPEEATEAYQRIVDEHPTSPYLPPAQAALQAGAPSLPLVGS